MKVKAEDLPEKIKKVLAEEKVMKKELDEVHAMREKAESQKMLAGVTEIGDLKFVSSLAHVKDMDELRDMADKIADRLENCVIVLATANDEGKVNLVVKADKKAVASGIHSGKIVKEISKLIGGGGGGRPDMAQAGGKNPDGLPKMFEAAEKLVREVVGK